MNTLFQTSVYIRMRENSLSSNPMYVAQSIIYDWMTKKERATAKGHMRDFDRRVTPQFRKDFMKRLDHEFYYSHSLCRTSYCLQNGEDGASEVSAWALRYNHVDAELTGQRIWHTDIAIRKVRSGVCVLNAAVAYEKDKYVLTENTNASTPQPNVPNFIAKLVEHEDLQVSPDPDFTFCFTKKDMLIGVDTAEEVRLLYSWVCSSMRRCAVVMCYGNQTRGMAKYFHNHLLGKALVIHLEQNREVASIMEDIDSTHIVFPNHIRVLYPLDGSLCMEKKNRWFHVDNIFEKNTEIVRNLLATFELRNRDAVRTIEDVAHMVTLARYRKQLNDKSAAEASQVSESEEKSLLNKLLSEEVARLEKDLESSKANLQYEQQRSMSMDIDLKKLKGQSKRIRFDMADLPYPGNMKELLKYYSKLFEDRIIVHDEAYDRAEDFTETRHLDKAWQMLKALAVDLYDMKFELGQVNEAYFANMTNFELSMTEGKETKKNSRLMKLRELHYNGKVYDITPHLKWGTKGQKLIRIYFSFILDERKILIGWAGGHMDNSSTRKLK